MLHALLLGSDRANARHAASLLRHFDSVSGACRGDEALAVVARRPIQVIATPGWLDDMSAMAFAINVRRWHPRRRPRLVLLTQGEASGSSVDFMKVFDAEVPLESDSAALSDALLTVASSTKSTRFKDELQGTFDELDFASLVQVIANGEKTGRLIVETDRGDGCLLYRQGLLVHAGSRGLDGRAAFRFLLHDLARRPRASFCFESFIPEALTSVRPTIACHLEQLLLEAA